ncbi:uncharacterized protein si:dkey-225f5.4 [Callorhinchus milii]|nr:uncharacterized protein si:dkey-225f5.4 [Callorhinchus milii]|eukprot:gi/632972202/ref/XP_007902544.1/ PREDICTED: uncharacterized protein LOC103185708 [Callorhinchus milii]
MAVEAIRGLLKEVEVARNLLIGCEEDERTVQEEAAVVQHAVGQRRNQKMIFRQQNTFALLLEAVKSIEVKDLDKSVQQRDIKAKLKETTQKWKSLKAECRLQEEEELQDISELLDKLETLETKKRALGDAIQLYEAKQHQLEEALKQKKIRLQQEHKLWLEKEVRRLERAIEECSSCITKCRVAIRELEPVIQSLAERGNLNHWLSRLSQTLETQSGIKVLSVSGNDMILNFDARVLNPVTKLLPLLITVSWTADGRVKIETNCSFLDLLDMATVDLPEMIAEVSKRYISQAELWSEIQCLQQRFAIDWLEERRTLTFLHLPAGSSSHVLYTFLVEPGYPANGGVRLCSVQGQNGAFDTVVQPSSAQPTLCDWLEHLNSVSSLKE